MNKRKIVNEVAEYPVLDADGKPYDYFLDGIAEWEKRGCGDDLGVMIARQLRKARCRGELPKPIRRLGVVK